jgi:hypothetical protein
VAGVAQKEILHKPLKRRVLRKRISTAEAVCGAGIVVVLALIAFWVVSQKDSFDPAERDISFEALQRDSVEDTLYRTPLRRWVEPGSAPSSLPAVDLGIFPPGLLDDGWELDGRVETYDSGNLYEKIDGAAEQYLAFGFRELHYVTLTRDESFLNVELYDQGSFANALGLFSSQRDVNRAVSREGDVYYYDTPAGAVGGFRNFYFKIAGDSTSPAILEKAKNLVALLARIPAPFEPMPLPYAILTERLGLPLERISYVKDDVFQYDFLSDFWFGAADDGSQARYFLHESDGPQQATALFDRLVREQLFDYSEVRREENLVFLRHKYLNTIFALGRAVTLIYGVEGAESPDRSRELLARLDEVVNGEDEADPAS